MKMIQEFRDFAVKGNVVDMAVGILIGSAFGKIVASLVSDVLMPPLGKLMGGVSLSNLFITLGPRQYATLAEARQAGAATLNYGVFLDHCISFLIISLAAFLMIKALNSAKRKQAASPQPAATPPPRQEVLLEEIRDLLKAR